MIWQQAFEYPKSSWTEAKAYIQRLNEQRYAGSSHWRLRTIEELASLIEPVPNDKDRYIHSAFRLPGTWMVWSADKDGGPKWGMLIEDQAWTVGFELGNVNSEPLGFKNYVLAVSPLLPAYADEALWEGLNAESVALYRRGRYAEAAKVAKDALKVAEDKFTPDHPSLSTSLNNLAVVYQAQGKYAEAEPLHKRALAIRESALGPDHRQVAESLNDLASLYHAQGKYAEAEPLDKRAVVVWEMAAKNGYAEAQYRLGMMYHQGRGVVQDHREDVRWFREAAEQGHAGARAELGTHLVSGTGVPADPVSGYMWLLLATQSDARFEVLLERQKMLMSPKDVAEAERRAAEWRPHRTVE